MLDCTLTRRGTRLGKVDRCFINAMIATRPWNSIFDVNPVVVQLGNCLSSTQTYHRYHLMSE